MSGLWAFASCDLMTTEKAQVRPSVPTGRILLDNNHITMRPGETRELKATVFPTLTYDKTNLTPNEIQNAAILSMLITDKTEWTSSDAEIASVDESGIVTAIKEGTCKITVKSGEHEFTCDVLVDFQKRADEEFLEYVERIGAYTELPLGTDGNAGSTAQYVTFGFDLSDTYDRVQINFLDKHTVATTYKDYNYVRHDDKWYQFYGSRDGIVYRELHEVIPKKWWLCDKEKGLMFLEKFYACYSFPEFFGRNVYKEDRLAPYIEQMISALKEITTFCDYETSCISTELDEGQAYAYVMYYYKSDGPFDIFSHFALVDFGYADLKYRNLYILNTERQLAQIKEMDLDCGEGGYTKKRMFIPSEEEIKACFSNGYKIPYPYYFNRNNKYALTRTRKKIDGKNKLCAVRLNEDGSFKEFTYLDGYTLLNQYQNDDERMEFSIIPAICVKPAP